jgi:hypothetical protein
MMERTMRLPRAGWGVVVAAIVLLATPGSEARSKRGRSRPFAVSAHVVDFEKPAHAFRRARQHSFDGYQTHTLELDVFRRGRSRLERATQVKLYLPNGDLYSAIDLEPVETEADANPRRRRARRRAPTATARLRVSGTAITRYGLYGDWRVDVCWETGSTTTCRRALTFEIH